MCLLVNISKSFGIIVIYKVLFPNRPKFVDRAKQPKMLLQYPMLSSLRALTDLEQRMHAYATLCGVAG